MSQSDWKFLKPLAAGTPVDAALATNDTLQEALYKLQGQINVDKDDITILQKNIQGSTLIDLSTAGLSYQMTEEESLSSLILFFDAPAGCVISFFDTPNAPAEINFFNCANQDIPIRIGTDNGTVTLVAVGWTSVAYGYTMGIRIDTIPPGDRGDITVSDEGRTWTINNGAVTKTDVGLSNVPNVDCTDAANITSGVFNIDRIPKAAIATLKPVADQAARYALTNDPVTGVQNGDTVKQIDTNTMYYVIDDTNLDNAAGYDSYDASVDWSAITSIPIPVSSLVGTNTGDETATSIGAIIAAASTKASLANADKFVIANSADGNIGYSVSWTDLKANIKTYADTLYLDPNDVSGTANQINTSAGVGTVTISLPSTMIAPGSIQASTTLTVGTETPLNLPNWIFQATTNVNGYSQLSLQNKSAANAASSDTVLTADNGSDTTHYIDLGINSSTYNQAAYNIGGANDGYLYTASGNLAIGTAAAKDVIFHTGGTTSANEVGRWKNGVGLQSVLGFIVTTAVNSFTTALGIALKVIPGAAASATSIGNTTTIQGGPGGSTSGAGGAVSIIGGTPVSGAGGAVTVAGAGGVGTNQNGGNLTIQGGAATGSGTAGLITAITAGVTRLIIGAAGGWTINGSEGTIGQTIVSQGASTTPKFDWPSTSPSEYSTAAATGSLGTGDTILTFANSDITSSHVTKLAGNQEFEFQRAGKYKIEHQPTFVKTSAAGGSTIYRGRLQLSTNGAAYGDITRSRVWATSPNNGLGASGNHQMTASKTTYIDIPTVNATKDKIRAVVNLDQNGGGTETCDSATIAITYLGPI